MEQIYEGKAKLVFASGEGEVTIRFKDDATAGNGLKKASIGGKGILNNRMTTILFEYLEGNGVPTHFIEQVDERDLRCTRTTVIPLEVIVRNIAAGSLVKRLGIERGTVLDPPTVEYSYKNDALGDPLLNDDHIVALGIASKDELAHIRKQALLVNELLLLRFATIGMKLVDFKLEFGKTKEGTILLVDEISGDNCRLWNKEGTSFDKDRFREDSGDLIEGYNTILRLLEESI
jgi:phosphoribosylaminoimidazole-succinocarboxamide synthase